MAIETRLTKFLNKRKWLIPFLFIIMCLYLVATIVVVEVKGFDNFNQKFAFSIGGELCAIIVAVVLTISILPAYKRQSGYVRVFVTLLTVGCSCCFLDAFQMAVDGVANLATLNKILCICVFINDAIFVFFFWLFSTYTLKSEGKIIQIFTLIATIGLFAFVILPLVNIFYPIYFTVNTDGVYARNYDTWWICRVFIILIAVFVIIAAIMSKESIKTKIVTIVFMLLPFISMIVGRFKYGVSLLYSAMMVSLVLIFSFLFADNEKALFSTNKELGLATSIQKHMLPSIFPAFPERREFDVYASMDPAKEVGGDFYDFFLVDDYHLAIVIADVSDKGVPAALFMMASKIMVQNYTLMGYSPKDVLERVNKQICSNNQDEMFVTVWLGILDLKTGILTASNAGHEKPIVKKPDGSFEVINDKHGFVVGWFATSKYSEYEIKLEKGSKLFVYTDGVPEATGSQGQFGMNRTLETLNKYKDKAPQDICQNLLNDIYVYMGNYRQFDDITMVCVEYRGYKDNVITKTIPAEKEHIRDIVDPIEVYLRENGADNKAIYKIAVALDEVLTNIASYAYTTNNGQVTVQYEIDEENEKMIIINIIDEGKAFNPLTSKEPDTTLPLEQREIGGLGLFIVKKTMDDVEYIRKNNKNILTLKKKI